MRTLLVASIVVVFFVFVGLRATPTSAAGRPISTINAVIGDRSFVARHGRAPTADDDPIDRVQTHLAYVERVLRGRDVAALTPAQRAMRTRLLDHLADYVQARGFPRGEAPAGFLPTFIDDRGARCAVAYLVEQSAGTDAARALDRRYHNRYIAQFDDAAFASWVARSGFTRDELAMVQPAYPTPRTPLPTVQLDTRYDAATDGTQLATAQLGVRHNLRHNYYLGDINLGLDGGLGWVSGDRTAYSAAARIGTEMLWAAGILLGDCSPCHAHRTGVSTGLAIDAAGDRISRAWSIPFDAYWYHPTSRRAHLGIVGGTSWAFAGADRGLGLRAGLDLVVRNVFDHHGLFGPRNVHIGAGVNRLAGMTFVGLTVGIANTGRYDVGRDW
jgi:hypothetical protein